MPPKAQQEERRAGQVTLEGVRLVFRNFSGAPGRFNSAGDRNFNVVLPEEIAREMEADGWNIRWLEPRDEDDPRQPILKVSLKYEKRDGTPTRPPLVVLITSKGRTNLDQGMVSLLDWAEIVNVDMIVNPYTYNAQGRTGISAYLKSIYVTIQEDPLELKYLDVPDSGQSALPVTENDG